MRSCFRVMVHEHIENAVDHAEVVVAVGVLLLDVDEVLREAVEPGSGHPQDRKRRTRLVAQEVERLRYRVHLDVRTGSNRRRRDLVEHHRHLPEHCPWGVDARERDAVALHVHGSGDKHQHAVVADALFNQDVPSRQRTQRQALAIVEQFGHRPMIGPRIVPREGLAGVQSVVLPAVSPAATYRWEMRKTNTTGRIEMTTPTARIGLFLGRRVNPFCKG